MRSILRASPGGINIHGLGIYSLPSSSGAIIIGSNAVEIFARWSDDQKNETRIDIKKRITRMGDFMPSEFINELIARAESQILSAMASNQNRLVVDIDDNSISYDGEVRWRDNVHYRKVKIKGTIPMLKTGFQSEIEICADSLEELDSMHERLLNERGVYLQLE